MVQELPDPVDGTQDRPMFRGYLFTTIVMGALCTKLAKELWTNARASTKSLMMAGVYSMHAPHRLQRRMGFGDVLR